MNQHPSVSYEIAMMSGSGFCRLRKLIEMIALPHIGPSGPVSSNLPIYHRKVNIYEGTADECRAMHDVLVAPNAKADPTADGRSVIFKRISKPTSKPAPRLPAHVRRILLALATWKYIHTVGGQPTTNSMSHGDIALWGACQIFQDDKAKRKVGK